MFPVLLVLAIAAASRVGAASPLDPVPVNTDEARAGAYTLPELLVTADGRRVTDREMWRTVRRPELIEALATEVYGRTPTLPVQVRARILATRSDAVEGLATRTLVELQPLADPDAPKFVLMLHVPNGARAPAPVLLGLNFSGLSAIEADPTLPERDPARHGYVPKGKAVPPVVRGANAAAWPLALALRRGYAVATFFYGDLEPDRSDGWRTGLRGHLLKGEGRATFRPDEWGAIGVWAWGLSRALDYLATHPGIDARRAAVFGHSRHGKTALWAGAQDERLALVISNDSGEGGASLGRRDFGERIADSIRTYGYWYCGNYRGFVGRPEARKTDQHMLLALAAPRALYVASATEDTWADPRGEFLGAVEAAPAYRLFGFAGLGAAVWPAPDQPVFGQRIGYHLRTGRHAILAYDWARFMDFADRQWGEGSAHFPSAP